MEKDEVHLRNKLNNLIKISVIIGILLISGSIAYYFVFFLPQQEKAKTNAAIQKEAEMKLKEEERQLNLDACLNEAEANHISLQRANGKGRNFSMPLDLANLLERKFKDARDDCYKKFPSVKQ